VKNTLDKFKKELEGKKILITGGTGMIGREIVNILCDQNCIVKSVSLDDLKLNKKAEYIKGDLSDFKFCLDITNKIDYVFHIAGIKGSVIKTQTMPSSFFVPLIMMNTNILESCRKNNVKKIVYTSSIGAYSSSEVFYEDREKFEKPPMDLFPGWAKRMAELQIETYKIQYKLNNFSIIRPSNVYGPGDNFDDENAMVIPSLMNKIFRGDDPVTIWGDGSAERDFIFSKDCAVGIILACLKGTDGKALNMGSGDGVSIKKLVETLNEIVDFRYKFDTSKSSGYPKRIMNMDKTKKNLNFTPNYSLKEGIKITWEWFVKNNKEYLLRKNYFKDSR
jgi:GDP-L-fucose synthase